MDNAFEVLEEKVRKTAELVRRLRKEKAELEEERGGLRARLKEAEQGLASLEKQRHASAAEGREAEALGREVKVLRAEREEVRQRIGKLVDILDGLD
jgi:predicted RNase H-like nuclease (RuvC/YqgF family)